MRALTRLRAFRFALALLLTACGGGAGEDGLPEVVLRGLEGPTPVLPGTRLRAVGDHLDTLRSSAVLELRVDDAATFLPRDAAAGGAVFEFTDEAALDLGAGVRVLTARIVDGERVSAPFAWEATVALSTTPTLDAAPDGDLFRNDDVLLDGDGFVSEDEGTLVAHLLGTFSRAAGGPIAVDARLPVAILDPSDRTRAALRVSSAVGGIGPGTFEGTVALEATFRLAAGTETAALPTAFEVLPPTVFEVRPTEASLEQRVEVRGGGFVGGPDTGEATLLRFSGTFTPRAGVPADFGPEDVVLAFERGSVASFVVESRSSGGILVSSLFGAKRGTFSGTVAPLITSATEEFLGESLPVELTLGPARQVVWLKFLPGFYPSLAAFGLTAAAGTIEGMIAERIEAIYGEWPVEVRLERPADVSENGFAVVEIGGPDPNGLGLFGYDNTPGKDVGNLRLFDELGGTNAVTQSDGFPGYGGVFIESLFVFSARPPVDLPASPGAGADPLFDEVFDPVRARPATLTEIRTPADTTRSAAVARALRALAFTVGETAAHELGHSFGLANPFGAPTAYHDMGDAPGCLMEAGSARPFGERAGEAGFSDVVLCFDAPAYLDSIFAVDP